MANKGGENSRHAENSVRGMRGHHNKLPDNRWRIPTGIDAPFDQGVSVGKELADRFRKRLKS